MGLKIGELLDDKALKAFENFCIDKYGVIRSETIMDDLRNGDIVAVWGYLLEFFDSVGIDVEVMISRSSQSIRFHASINGRNPTMHYTRKAAQLAAMEKANTLYNEEI